ncbi:hypothetical protein ACFX5K_02330 [Rickettsiales bacterium LUAb2]
MLKSIFVSLGFGIIALFMLMSLFMTDGAFIFKYFLFIFAPFPILLSILTFNIWGALISFVPLFASIFYSVDTFLIIIASYLLPLIIVYLFINVKKYSVGKYIPVIFIAYAVIALIATDIILLKNNLILPDITLDFVDTVLFQIKGMSGLTLPANIDTTAKLVALTLPAIVGIMFFIIMNFNYVLANWVSKNNNTQNQSIGSNLPKYYIHMFILELILCLLIHFTVKDSWHVNYILYNIAMIMFIGFLVPGLGLISFIVNKNKIFLFLFILIFFVSSVYLIAILCLLGFLKEAKVFNYKL